MKAGHKILVIDDESDVGDFVCDAAAEMGLECVATTDAIKFLEALNPATTLILLDLMMPEFDGIELLRILANRNCKTEIVLMSGVGKRTMESAGQLAQTLGLTIVGHLQKPFRLVDLEVELRREAEAAATPVIKPDLHFVGKEELLHALANNKFVLHYQPQVEIKSGAVLGLEALVRWQHPERGLIFPDYFIGRMEEFGLIDQLGWLVVNLGLSEVVQFADEDGIVPALSVNESVYSLHDLKFPDVFVAHAEKYGIPPSKITIEITEGGLIQELSKTLDILTRLRMKQVKLSIDDFGVGYAMMQQLKNIPATELKIDRSFVHDMNATDRDRVMVQKTIELGHELGMRVIAEGVETKEQLEWLRLAGCDGAQGYFFSRALPAAELVDWLRIYRTGLTSKSKLFLVRGYQASA